MDGQFDQMINEEYFLNSLSYMKDGAAFDGSEADRYAAIQNMAKILEEGEEKPAKRQVKKDKLAFFNEM